MNKTYRVRLSAEERSTLEGLISVGKAAAATQTHARILLKADEGPLGPGWTDEASAAALEVSIPTIQRVRQALVIEGFEAAVYRRAALRHRRPKLDGHQEAQLVALTCSTPPAGHERWTLRLLADRLVTREIVEGIAPETVRRTLKKTSSSRG
jgi:Homeodomain-like domain